LTNNACHSHAREVWIDLKQKGEELHLIIRDDGRGFDVAAARKQALKGGNWG
jgi:signal transduction histidine kinase